MSIFSTFDNYFQLARCAAKLVRDFKHMTFEEAHPRRAACANEMLEALKVTYDVENRDGLRIGRPCIYVANHTAMIDSVVMCAVLPYDVRFLAKKELFSVPLLKRVLRLEKHIPVFRGKEAKAHIDDLKKSIAEAFADGASCLIFPEGTRSLTGEMGPFKLGAFYNAVQNNVPIVPVALEGLFAINPKTRKAITPGHAVVHVLAPIEVPDGTDEHDRAQKLADLAKQAIADAQARQRHVVQ